MTSPQDPAAEPDRTPGATAGRSKKPLVIGAAVVVVLLVGAALFWFLRDDAPDRVSLEDAIADVSTTTATTAGDDPAGEEDGSSTTAAEAASGVEGDWIVDTESGEFDYESATGSFVGFRIDEELVGVGATEAVGRTGDVTGTMTIDGTTVNAATFEVDMTTITTNERRRDDRVQSALATGEFPSATFELTAPIELGAGAAGGEAVTATATGDLTIKGVTNPIELPIEAKLVEGTVVVVGTVEIVFSDYGVEVPSAPVVVSASDRGDLELQLLLIRG